MIVNLLAALALSASAYGPDKAQPTDRFRGAVADVSFLSRSLYVTDEKVNRRAFEVFNRDIPSTQISVQARFKGWDFEPAPELDVMTPEKLMATIHDRLAGKTLPTELAATVQYAEIMMRSGRVAIDKNGFMSPAEAGVFVYQDGSPDPGNAFLNQFMVPVSYRLGRAIPASVLIHEIAHALAKFWNQLHPDKVIDGEKFAFKVQRQYLMAIDPEFMGIDNVIRVRKIAAKDNPSIDNDIALAVAQSIGDLCVMGDTEKGLEDYIAHLGYREGHGLKKPASQP